ncbi:MAG: flagellar basal body L-ring protein FlgH [Halioglobus sp.]
MKFSQIKWLFLLLLAFLVGCMNSPNRVHPDYASAEPIDYYPEMEPTEPTGSIYADSGYNMVLFEDLRARQVGDILTVLLAEATDAAKTSDTTLDKSNSTSITDPILGGQARVIGSDSTLGFDLSSSHAFDGESASNQSNSLQGSITVTIAKVFPGGNLYIQGEKWIQINQGNEYIRLRGIIRPVDISTTNTIVSTKIADARISYGGTGATADVNKVGWLSRFFISPIWPF